MLQKGHSQKCVLLVMGALIPGIKLCAPWDPLVCPVQGLKCLVLWHKYISWGILGESGRAYLKTTRPSFLCLLHSYVLDLFFEPTHHV